MAESIDPTPNAETSDSPDSVDLWVRLLTNTVGEINRRIIDGHHEDKYPDRKLRRDRIVIDGLLQDLKDPDYVFDKDSMDSLMGSGDVINRYVPEQLAAEARESEDLRIALRSKNLD
jgi:hypothetical protein